MFTGFQFKNVSVETCVKDAESVVDNFEKAFAAFEDREIYKGLHLVGYGLTGAVSAMKDCNIEKEVVAGIEKFVKDLVSCIKGLPVVLFVIPLYPVLNYPLESSLFR